MATEQELVTAMKRLFNEHTADYASEYFYRHPDDEKFMPEKLTEPRLINMTVNGFTDSNFDVDPWFEEDSASSGRDRSS